ncbi:MAG TPA: periplasmic heavy metal sensor [Nitrospira sp.]|nr:periplasmic heavy metal sensor [Nitrospira sp.]
MKRGWFLTSIVLGSALIAAPSVWAYGAASCQGGKGHLAAGHGGHGGHGHKSGTSHLLRHLLKDKQELGLTDEQVTQLRKTALEADRAQIRAVADMMVSKRELRSLMWDEKADMAAIEAKVKEKEGLEATVQIIGIKAKRDLLGALTPDQKTKWKALWEQRRTQSRGHMMRAEADEAGLNETSADSDPSGFEVTELEDELSAA